MGNIFTTKKLDHHNYTSWSYRMQQHLVGQGYWTYIIATLETKLSTTNPLISTMANSTKIGVMQYVNSDTTNHMMNHKVVVHEFEGTTEAQRSGDQRRL
jgi:hypothetical protein